MVVIAKIEADERLLEDDDNCRGQNESAGLAPKQLDEMLGFLVSQRRRDKSNLGRVGRDKLMRKTWVSKQQKPLHNILADFTLYSEWMRGSTSSLVTQHCIAGTMF